MQKKMIADEPYVLLPIPLHILKEADMCANDTVQYVPLEGRIIVQSIRDSGDFFCNGVCGECPMNEIDCDGECESCPCYEKCDDAKGGFFYENDEIFR